MKKMIATVLSIILLCTACAAFAEQVPTDIAATGTTVGGWVPAADPTITEDVKALVEKATEGLLGVNYEPVTYLGSQLVAGTNHAILCKATVVNLNAIPTWKILYVYEDLQGNVSILNIADFDAGSLCTYGAAE
jgi:hypothetical protein